MATKFITVTQAAEQIGCSRQYVNKLIQAGRFKSANKISDEVHAPYLIDQSEVTLYLKTRTKPLNKKAE